MLAKIVAADISIGTAIAMSFFSAKSLVKDEEKKHDIAVIILTSTRTVYDSPGVVMLSAANMNFIIHIANTEPITIIKIMRSYLSEVMFVIMSL